MLIDRERAFLEIVRAFADIGYGRMMQLVSHEWWRYDKNGALVASSAFALLSPGDRLRYENLASFDPAFGDWLEPDLGALPTPPEAQLRGGEGSDVVALRAALIHARDRLDVIAGRHGVLSNTVRAEIDRVLSAPAATGD